MKKKGIRVLISNLLKGVGTVTLSVVLSGCATIVSGTTQKISVTSMPTGAVATADNNMSAKTPALLTLDRKNDHAIEITKEGYKTATVLIKRTMNGAGFGNILLGGIVGIGVDAASGASNKLIPERVDVVLEQGEGQSASPKFAAAKDQEFYDSTILKFEKAKQESEAMKSEREAKKAEETKVAATQPATANNFAVKRPAAAVTP